jgi:hypothetical protein
VVEQMLLPHREQWHAIMTVHHVDRKGGVGLKINGRRGTCPPGPYGARTFDRLPEDGYLVADPACPYLAPWGGLGFDELSSEGV